MRERLTLTAGGIQGRALASLRTVPSISLKWQSVLTWLTQLTMPRASRGLALDHSSCVGSPLSNTVNPSGAAPPLSLTSNYRNKSRPKSLADHNKGLETKFSPFHLHWPTV